MSFINKSIKYLPIFFICFIFFIIFILCFYNNKIIDSFTNEYKEEISPEYSHTVNLPINDPLSCKNFCGPMSQCAITRTQCTSDIDCFGCTPNSKKQYKKLNPEPYYATGKLTQNQGLQYSSLTTGYDNHGLNFAESKPGSLSNDNQLITPYQGKDNWMKSFNVGLDLYNKNRIAAEKYNEGNSNNISVAYKPYIDNTDDSDPVKRDIKENPNENEPKYPMSVSLTGAFYETTPPAANENM
jgi:hypothetical protein